MQSVFVALLEKYLYLNAVFCLKLLIQIITTVIEKFLMHSKIVLSKSVTAEKY